MRKFATKQRKSIFGMQIHISIFQLLQQGSREREGWLLLSGTPSFLFGVPCVWFGLLGALVGVLGVLFGVPGILFGIPDVLFGVPGLLLA